MIWGQGVNRARSTLVLLFAALVAAGCATTPRRPALPGYADQVRLLADSLLVGPLEAAGASVGVVVGGVDGGRLYAHDDTRLLLPASIQKLAVAADALLYLPGAYRWQTRFAGLGVLDSAGVLPGDLAMVGGWDPTLAGPHPYMGWPWGPFDTVAARLAQTGLTRIEGNLRAVGTVYIPNGWEAADFDEAYAPAIASLMWNDGLVTSYAGAVGDSAMWRIWPDPEMWSADHGAARVWSTSRGPVASPPEDNTLWPGNDHMMMRPVQDPRRLSADAFREALHRAGIAGGDSTVTAMTLPAATEDSTAFVYTRWSANVDSVLSPMLKVSSNAWAEQIEAAVEQENGFEPGGLPHWPLALDSLGVPRRGLRATDACGMSRKNNVAPATIQDLLVAANAMWPDRWVALLARADEPGSTLRGRLEGLGDRVAAKTGSLSRCRSLAGYLLDHGVPVLAFTIIVNNAPVDPVPFMDAFVTALATLERGPANPGGM